MTAAATSLTAPSAARATRVERAVRAVQVVAGIHVLALVLVLTHRGAIVASVSADNPAWSMARVDQVARQLWISVAVPHVLLALVFFVRARRLRTGGTRARAIVTCLLGLQIASRLSLPYQLAVFPGQAGWLLTVQAVSLIFEIAALRLLWRR